MDEELIQEFLVEAGELIEALNEQLLELEESPTDKELLNAVFRGFHTIKGGAGFLDAKPLIEVCHRAENVLDKIRGGKLEFNGGITEAIVKAYDVICEHIDNLRDNSPLQNNDPELILQLDKYSGTNPPSEAEEVKPVEEKSLTLPDGLDPDGDISEDEFEALLRQRDAQETKESGLKLSLEEGVDPDGDISEDEFEALLDQREMIVSETRVETPSKKSEDSKENKPAKKPVESSVRVDTRRLDDIMNLVGELVLVRNRLLTLRTSSEPSDDLSNAVANLDHVTTDLQSSVMKTRMQPVKKVFGRFPRVVRDLSRSLGKEIELSMNGENTDLDKNLVEALADPLVHLIRNSCDHGIEMPDERAEKGKPRKGQIVLSAEQEGDHILLSIADDGKGISPEMLRKKAVEKGMMDEVAAAKLDDKSALGLIMSAGFSTAEAVSDLSGRGVGMDVVKSMITKLNGSIDIHSVPNEGTRMSIRVPLTLAILPTLMVSFGDDNYAIPLTSVQEIFDYDTASTNKVDGQMMVRLRDQSVPLHFISEWLAPSIDTSDPRNMKVVIVSVGNQKSGLIVEQVNGQEEIVIKPLGNMLKSVQGYAGATITGNGNIAFILDLPGVISRFQ
jgi:two-component system chemotaxis sensor kinase CheA